MLFSAFTDIGSLLLLLAVTLILLGLRGFKQSRQAIVESESLITRIVGTLTSRIESSETLLDQLRLNYDSMAIHQAKLEEKIAVRTEYSQVLRYIQELLTHDKEFVNELERLKSRFLALSQTRTDPKVVARPELVLGGNMLDSLTDTEREVVGILREEGPKPAPELGHRLGKSREHMARLMKKLYLEGYVDRESNRTPFRYRLSEKMLSTVRNEAASTPASSEGA
jgi:hypothetical protein